MNKCYSCGSKTEPSVELIVVNGRSIPQQVMRCNNCGNVVVSSEEYERVRKELHPSLIERMHNFFKPNIEFIDILKGRLL